MSNRVEINTTAPELTLNDFNGNQVKLSDFLDENHVVLIFNRGFQ